MIFFGNTKREKKAFFAGIALSGFFILASTSGRGLLPEAEASSGSTHEEYCFEVPPPEELTSFAPEDVLFLAIQRCRNLDAYRCRLTLHLTKGERIQNSEYVFSYKKPNLIRMEVKGGKDRGSTVILREDGCIRARREGLLSLFAITMKPDDQRLYDLWDRFFCDSDWLTLLSETMERMQEVQHIEVSAVNGGEQILLVSDSKDFTEKTWLDSERLILLEKQAQLANGDSLQAVWSDIDLNPVFEEGFFHF